MTVLWVGEENDEGGGESFNTCSGYCLCFRERLVCRNSRVSRIGLRDLSVLLVASTALSRTDNPEPVSCPVSFGV